MLAEQGKVLSQVDSNFSQVHSDVSTLSSVTTTKSLLQRNHPVVALGAKNYLLKNLLCVLMGALNSSTSSLPCPCLRFVLLFRRRIFSICLPRREAAPFSKRSTLSRRSFRAIFLLVVRSRASWQWTRSPVGMCTSCTHERFLLMACPPGPRPRTNDSPRSFSSKIKGPPNERPLPIPARVVDDNARKPADGARGDTARTTWSSLSPMLDLAWWRKN